MAGDLELENLEEYIIDEDKIVTYKWLSKTLSLHVNQAKKYLEKFVKTWRQKPSSEAISVTYLVSGIQTTQSGIELTKVVIAAEDRLEDVKTKFKEVLGQHVYSVQKSHLKDSNALFTTDFDQIKNELATCNRFSAITCKDATPRSSEDLQRLKKLSQPSSVPKQQTTSGTSQPPKLNGHGGSVPQKTQKLVKKKGLDAFTVKKSKDEDETKEEKQTETKVSKPPSKQKKGGLFAYTTKKSSKSSSPTENIQAESSKTQDLEKSKESKSNDKEQSKEKEVNQDKSKGKKESQEKSKEKSEDTKPAVKDDGKDGDKEEELVTLKKKPHAADKRKARNISVSDSDEEKEKSKKDVKGKKRRRVIQEMSSSDESEEEDEDMDDEPIPPTPEPRKALQEKEEPPQGVKRKGRKAKKVKKKKTYVDEDGCMVTENVWEWESTDASSDDEAPPPKKAPAPAQKEVSPKKKKGSPPSSGKKQTALTSFFKKK